MNILSSKELQQQRLNICLQCPDLGFVIMQKITRCDICKCPIKSKIAVQNSSCPKGKW
jgi:hypothetical protein